ncbi:nucleotidyltransferase family protein [Gemmatimonadota bacterium]
MTGMLEEKREAIAELCRRHGVLRLEVFGSSLREEFNPAASDFDFLVEFEAMEPYARVDAYFGLLEELQNALGREVDLVMVDAVTNPYIAREIERTKQLLYAA